MTPKTFVLPLAALAGAGAMALSTSALAQTTVQEITVMGRYGDMSNARSLSQTVSYADLNLATPAGQAVFKQRLKLTARYLCDRLGETAASDPVAPSCREKATADAMRTADAVIASYPTTTAVWVAGPVWAAPYPTTWVELYP